MKVSHLKSGEAKPETKHRQFQQRDAAPKGIANIGKEAFENVYYP